MNNRLLCIEVTTMGLDSKIYNRGSAFDNGLVASMGVFLDCHPWFLF
jgi:hypothetical protein